MTAAPPNWVFSMFSFIGFVLCCIPFPWHLQAWNTGTCLYMGWTGLACLTFFINSVIWNHNAINWAPVWCDITARLIIGFAVAIPTASLCINRSLHHIACMKSVTTGRAEKCRAIVIDLALGIGIPVLEMLLQYIPQGHRFNIYEDVGCFPWTYSTPVAVLLVYVWPVVIGSISAVYSILAIIAFNKSQKEFNQYLSSHNSLTKSRYLRLMCLAGFETLCTVPIGLYLVVQNTRPGIMEPWLGWADTHSGFSRVDQVPAIKWRYSGGERDLELSRWFVVICAFAFFGFFGFAEEARKNYCTAVQYVAKKVGVPTDFMGTIPFGSSGTKSAKDMTSSSRVGTLPVFTHRQTLRECDDLDSISEMSASLANEKKSPDLSYGAMSLSDVGDALADDEADTLSPTPISGSSSATHLSPASPSTNLPQIVVTRPPLSIEISSVAHHGGEPPVLVVTPPSGTPDTGSHRGPHDIV